MSEAPPKAEEGKKEQTYPLDFSKGPVVTKHKVGDLKYTATVGLMPINDEFGEPEGGIFYIAYTKDGVKDPSNRPVMFSFNGGPGSSSVWLHLGVVGPKRVVMEADGNMPKPPFKLVDNEYTWLENTDLVFIDPIGTGYSRPAKKDGGKKFWSLEGDIESIGEFIRLYLTRNNRWGSKLHLVGESYGTTRAAGLSGHLIEKGIAFNSIVLVSSILNFQTARFNKGNDLPYQVFLPTYTATAWFHKKTKYKTLESALKASEEFAASDYVLALAKGASMTDAERKTVRSKLSALTGLSEDYVEATDLRVNIHRFCKELLRNEKRTVGRLDSRFKGIDENAATEHPEHDPSMTAIMAPYTATINDYLRRELGWETDQPYYVFNPGELWKNWSYGDAGAGHPDTSESLRAALSKNPYMKVFIASGYYDLATPYFATEYTLNHLGLDSTLRDNIQTKYYEAGHMMYIDEGCLKKLHEDISDFYK
ncbi:MAG: peptidase S10 [Armatimonadetes bacterium]|nr:peptidase S10 [Armatimonadota bacterium]MBS1726476.1 peptidase S10 [Armatimonadota bacterium]